MQKSEKIAEMKTERGLAVRSYHDESTGLDVMSFENKSGYRTDITMYSFINRFDYGWNEHLADYVDAVFEVYSNELSGGDAIVFAMIGTHPSESNRRLGYKLHIASFRYKDNIRLFRIADEDRQLAQLNSLTPEEAKIIGSKAVIDNDKYKVYVRKSSSP